jgi:pyruvate dehydrogenase E1 component alpha subunit
MRALRVDGNDVIACMLAVAEAAEHARRGHGPSLIEAVTYRVGPHTTSDDPTRYRDAAEVDSWLQRDPIERCKAYMQRYDLWSDQIELDARDKAADRRTRLRASVVDAPDPELAELFDHVFTVPTSELVQQRASLVAELERRV